MKDPGTVLRQRREEVGREHLLPLGGQRKLL